MRQLGRTLYPYAISIFMLGVAVQFFLAGLGAFRVQHSTDGGSVGDKGFGHAFDPHVQLGHILQLVGFIVFLLALAARLGRARVLQTLALPVLVFLQSVFANTGPTWFRALHGVTALVIAGLGGSLAARAWRERRAAT